LSAALNTRVYSVPIHYAASISIKSEALRISYAFAAKKRFKQPTKSVATWPTGGPELGNRRVYCLTTKFTSSLFIRNRIETQRQPALSLTPACRIPNELRTSTTEHVTHRASKPNGKSLHLTSFRSQTVFRSFSAQSVYDGSPEGKKQMTLSPLREAAASLKMIHFMSTPFLISRGISKYHWN